MKRSGAAIARFKTHSVVSRRCKNQGPQRVFCAAAFKKRCPSKCGPSRAKNTSPVFKVLVSIEMRWHTVVG